MKLAILLVALMAAAAYAKPLPPGLVVSLKDQQVVVARGGVSVPLLDPTSHLAEQGWADFKGASLDEQGNLVVAASGCMTPGPLTVPLAVVEARLENGVGMLAHVKKDYAAAIPHFVAAAKGDPATPMYATNLLSAQSLAKRFDDADQTIATYAPAHRGWFAWRLAVDPELANVRDRPSAKPYRPKVGKLTSRRLTTAISPLGYAATSEWGGLGMIPSTDLVITDLKTGEVEIRVRLRAADDVCDDSNESNGMIQKCTKAMATHSERLLRNADAVLTALGFGDGGFTWAEAKEGDPVSPSKAISIEESATNADNPALPGLTVKRGGNPATIDIGDYNKVLSVGVSKDWIAVSVRFSYGCGGADSQQTRTVFHALP
jgi:hypothetical protein